MDAYRHRISLQRPPEVPGGFTPGVGVPAFWGDRPLDPMEQLLRRRMVVLSGTIDNDVAADVSARLLYLDAEAPGEPIVLRINSPGGEVWSGLGVLDTMTGLESPVETVCVGMAASMASVLLACGAHGRRSATANARVLIHQPWAGQFKGQATDLERAAKETLRLRARIDDILATATGQTVETIHTDTDRDTWFSAEEALAYGLIDSVRGQVSPPRSADGLGATGGHRQEPTT
jgi:ATP-dependent Clp protease protease subunit